MNFVATSPGKIILSGEHSVVYGNSAIVAAIAKYTRVEFRPIHRSRSIRAIIKGLPQGKSYPLHALEQLKKHLDKRFEQFSNGEISIAHILHRPEDLAIYALTTFLQHVPVPGKTQQRQLPMPGRLTCASELPLGAGMGSSAAAIAATIVLYEHIFQQFLTPLQRFQRVRFCERLQHGRGSALDAAAVVYGGVNAFCGEAITPLPLQLSAHWYWILHGIPSSSTGECVSQVRRHFAHCDSLWRQFEKCSQNLRAALLSKNSPQQYINENNELLCEIGVVTAQGQQFISALQKIGAAAKISGSGAIGGTGCGTIIAYHEDEAAMTAFMAQYPQLLWGRLTVASSGAAMLNAQSS